MTFLEFLAHLLGFHFWSYQRRMRRLERQRKRLRLRDRLTDQILGPDRRAPNWEPPLTGPPGMLADLIRENAEVRGTTADGVVRETQDEDGLTHSFGDEPACEWRDGTKAWFRHGLLHRDPNDGPAAIKPDGRRFYATHGEIHWVMPPDDREEITPGGVHWDEEDE